MRMINKRQMQPFSRAITLVCLVSVHTALAAPLAGSDQVMTVRELQSLMYREQAGTGGCYKLLNATDAIGCEEPSGQEVEAPLAHWHDLPSTLADDVVVLVPTASSQAFLEHLHGSEELRRHIRGVLVDDTDRPPSFSSAPAFSGAEYAPYALPGYKWNPAGSDVALRYLPLPIYALNPEMAQDARALADYNANRRMRRRGRLYHARMALTMAAAGAANSSACLEDNTCRPLGGYSVWAALPPLAAGMRVHKPTVVVLAQVDGLDMFHDLIQGADAPLSGLIAMLAAAYALHASGLPATYQKQLVFAALAGEGWGYMGSRRLLWEMAANSSNVAGLAPELIEQVVEIGQVGRAMGADGATQLYLHSQRGAQWGDAGGIADAFTAAAADVSGPGRMMSVESAAASNPGIPPSSLMTFLRVNSSIQGAVLAEFDTAFSNPYYASRFDNASMINSSAIASTSMLLTAALHRLAGGDPAQLQINATALQALVQTYVSCLTLPSPGLSCAAAQELMAPGYTLEGDGTRNYAAKHYVGVLRTLHPDSQSPFLKDDVYRFIWGVLAISTMAGERGGACDPQVNKCLDGQVCVGWKGGSKDSVLLGHCVNATVRYVPSLSTRLNCTACEDFLGEFKWVVSQQADAWAAQHAWPPDPMWTESDWPLGVPFLQLYLKEPHEAQAAVFVAGVLVTAASVVAALLARLAFHRHLKEH